MKKALLRESAIALLTVSAFGASATISVDAGRPGARISPGMYGIFFEEISHAGDGGLYAELIRNRGFEDANLPPACVRQGNRIIPPRTPHFWEQPKVSKWTMDWNVDGQWPGWQLRTVSGAKAAIDLVTDQPLTAASPHSLRIGIEELPSHGSVSLINEGYWGINVVSGETYRLSFYARASGGFRGPLSATLESADGRVLGKQTIALQRGPFWQNYRATIHALGSDPKARFVLSLGSSGTVWFDMVSLFPARTFHDRPNGMRPDIAQTIANLKPAFLRFPGGCFVEGISIENRAQWKTTLGPIEGRIPTYSPWGYWSTNGLGYHEFLQFAEDVGADALYVANAGISCAFRSGTFIPDEQLRPLIDDTLDAIEYAVGPVDSKWGSERAKAGHPQPFPLKYVEVGNEDEGPRYGKRFARFYQAIKARYPHMNVVLDSWISGIDRGAMSTAGKFEILDEHSYRPLYWSIDNFARFASYKREGWDLYIGEFATNGGVGHGNLAAALGDAAYMMSMENNADLVKMGSYAPLLENVNKPDWGVNLIHFDSSRVFGRAAYYMCKLFAENRPDIVLPTRATYTPEQETPIAGRIGLGTYNTAAEFKDIRVESAAGRVLYQSDFSKNASGWNPLHRGFGGTWETQDGLYRQKDEAVAFSYFDANDWHDITISLQARALHGHEGFVVVLGNAENRRIEWNVGGFGNTLHAMEADDEIIGAPVHAGVEYGRWYDVRVEVRGRTVRCYLDGKLTNEVTAPRVETVLAVAGRDEKTGEIVIKALNTGHDAARVKMEISGAAGVGARGKVLRLTSSQPTDENSFEDPRKIAPVATAIDGLGSTFPLSLPPWSVSIIRIPSR